MAAAKRRRKPARKSSGIGMGWWLAGLVGIGWIAYGSNPGLLGGLYERASSIAGVSERKAESARVAAQPRPAAPSSPAASRPTAPVPDRRSDVASVAKPALPATRPTPGNRPVVKRGQLRLLSEPRDGSTIRATVEPGKVLRIVESKGDWRRVEAGIFTGWVRAASLGAQAPAAMPTSMRPPSMQRERADHRLVPPAALGGRN